MRVRWRDTPVNPRHKRNLLLLLGVFLTRTSLASEEAFIHGQPQLVCTQEYAIVHLQTSEPFQGRISVMGLSSHPACSHEYSHNIQQNASAHIDLSRCTQSYFANNGSRIQHAHIDVSFHPLVVTNSDRVFHIQCVDNAFATHTGQITANNAIAPASCSHTARPASRWEVSTFFHLGDSIVHEWNCIFKDREQGRYSTFLTECNAISRSGEIIHLVDENGCIVDPDLMGELVYNNVTARIYARAKMFRFASGSMFRVECHLKMCLKESSCGQRTTIPRFDHSSCYKNCGILKHTTTASVVPLTFTNCLSSAFQFPIWLLVAVLLSDGEAFDHNLIVSSDWITVFNNHYTDIDQISDRYYLATELNRTLQVTPPQKSKHFLLGISFKEPAAGSSAFDEDDNVSEAAARIAESFESAITHPFGPPSNIQPFGSSLFPDIGQPPDIVDFPLPVPAFASTPKESTVLTTTTVRAPPTTTSRPVFVRIPLKPPIVAPTARIAAPPASVPPFTVEAEISRANKPVPTRSSTSTTTTTRSPPTTTTTATTTTTTATSELRVVTNRIDESDPGHATTRSTPSFGEDQEVPPLPGVEVNTVGSRQTDSDAMTTSRSRPLHKHVDLPARSNDSSKRPQSKADWRLDDGSFNETEIIIEKLITNCENNTQLAEESSHPCQWSSLEHLLLAWSIVSLAGWLLVLGFVVLRCAALNKPDWVQYRDGEFAEERTRCGSSAGAGTRRDSSSIVPPSSSLPWNHPDAFEHPRPPARVIPYGTVIHSRDFTYRN